ncbi:IclR family transcriptional regulator C-terminal domain-containing protein [Pseudomonas sp. BP8]|uniref:IclR family transcriptional regulator domain-containing protein n=1 Tax=Pseudomonas sp. BP8 TaxID=2817864 RepID=UPI001AE4F3CD|nr:IclR family transcriptional regulator C-terminal domain-containing protein [Pseudomonas sp. BP8]MBP2261619.1 DNA-binding IclR family transcriptional regulator [Pseudomonas sp. BP8]HDS1733523.1 helix-turn-helix domain-containing protein [Pseudomonas putida]
MPNASLEIPGAKAPAATSSHGRLIEVLDALVRRAEGEPWGVRELASELDESRSTINRILTALVDRDFAVEEGVGKYRVGPRFRVLMLALSNRSALLSAGRLLLDGLAGVAKQAALLSVYAPHLNGYYVLYCGEAQATLAFRPQIGSVYPLGFGDIGRRFSDFLQHTPGNDSQCTSSRVMNPVAPIAEYEFPPAVACVTRRLSQGLIITVSLHDLGGEDTKRAPASIEKVEAVVSELERLLVEHCGGEQHISADDDSSTVARLEGLLQILCAAPNGYLCSSGIASELHCNAATARKIVESASQASLVFANGKALYPGARLYQWAAQLNNKTCTTAKLCRGVIESLVKETGETVAFLGFDAKTAKAHFIEVVQGWRPIQYTLETGVDVPLYAGGAGKAVLAHLAPSFADGLVLKQLTDATIVSHEALQADLLAIRERGWSVGDGERVLGAFGIGVPFFVDGQVAGSLSATIPQYRKQDCDVPGLVESMKLATQRIGRLLSLGDSILDA